MKALRKWWQNWRARSAFRRQWTADPYDIEGGRFRICMDGSYLTIQPTNDSRGPGHAIYCDTRDTSGRKARMKRWSAWARQRLWLALQVAETISRDHGGWVTSLEDLRRIGAEEVRLGLADPAPPPASSTDAALQAAIYTTTITGGIGGDV